MQRLVKGDGRGILWSLARAALTTQEYTANDFCNCRFLLKIWNNKKTNSQIKYWSWKYSKLILQDRDQYRDPKYQDQDQDRINVVSSALETQMETTSLYIALFCLFLWTNITINPLRSIAIFVYLT